VVQVYASDVNGFDTKSFTEENYPAQAMVDVIFDNDLTLSLGGSGEIKLQTLKNSGVSSTQTVAFIANVLMVGDLVHHKAHAWLEGGIVNGKAKADLAAWKRALQELKGFADATLYGGRGEAAQVDEAVAAQETYLATMESW
jgi:hypothetical protein